MKNRNKIMLILLLTLSTCKIQKKEYLILPENFKIDNNENRNLLTFPKKKTTLIKYLNTDCSICIDELHRWQQLFSQYKKSHSIDLVFVASGNSKTSVDFIFHKSEMKSIYFYDFEYSFFDANQISLNRDQQGLFVLEDGEIKLRSSLSGIEDFLKKQVQSN
uniref:hypothetical protein n=1 Tax=Roseivirga sp. TaxID=1964215 RepID=UPI0040487FAB